jgi:hypothetical protein
MDLVTELSPHVERMARSWAGATLPEEDLRGEAWVLAFALHRSYPLDGEAFRHLFLRALRFRFSDIWRHEKHRRDVERRAQDERPHDWRDELPVEDAVEALPSRARSAVEALKRGERLPAGRRHRLRKRLKTLLFV